MVILNASDPKTAKQINDIIKKSKHVFILVYMVGCGPCNATRPEWKKMCESLENQYSSNDDVAILDLDSTFMNEVEGLGDVNGFPTMKYISNNGNVIESYDEDRNSNAFIKWIESKVLKKTGGGNLHSMNVNELSEILSSKQLNSAKTINSENKIKKIKTKRTKKTKKTKKTKRTKINLNKRIKSKRTYKRKK
jgi:hypothetical protein